MNSRLSNIKGFIILLGVFIFVAGFDIGLVSLYKIHIENFLKKQPEVSRADAGIIFFGDYTSDGSSLGPDSRQRAETAFALYKNKQISRIICVGGYDYRQWQGKPHLMKQYLAGLGIPAANIYHDSLSFNTITNWREARKIMVRQKLSKVVVISSPLHIYRISLMIDTPEVSYISYPIRLTTPSEYWRFFVDVHHEWLSHFLSFALKDEARNRIVYFIRTIRSKIDLIL